MMSGAVEPVCVQRSLKDNLHPLILRLVMNHGAKLNFSADLGKIIGERPGYEWFGSAPTATRHALQRPR